MPLKSPVDLIIVQLSKAFQDEITFESGVKLFKDVRFSPEWNTTVTGTVISVPNRLSKRHDLRGLSIEPKEGDEIIMSYMVVYDMDIRENDTPLHHNLFRHEGEYYWKVDYFHYLGRIVDGEIIPAQGYVFCEALEPEGEEKVGLIYVPDMKKKEVPKGKARVVSIGKPKNGEPGLSIEKGDIVRYSERYASKYEVHGKTYIVLNHNLVLATETV